MTPKDKLKWLESELQKAVAQSDNVAKLKAEIAALKKLISDQESSENQYAKEYAGVVQDQGKKKAVSDAQAKTVQDNTSDNDRKRVTAEAGEVDSKISALGVQLTAAATKADAAAATLAKKRDETKQAKDALASLKEPWKPAQKALKDADTLIASTDQQILAKNYLVGYFLVNETVATLKAANLDAPDTYSKKLATATEAVFDATNDEQAAKDDFDQKTADKNAAQKLADDAGAKRQDSIIRRINEGSTVPAPAPAAPAPAAPAPAVPAPAAPAPAAPAPAASAPAAPPADSGGPAPVNPPGW